ncbi:hypothetical protein COW36_21170 [bacterium (Candidatus Blackallbacteria) CG17_big_fil_post_rev_8_21_14_2_50_48_46]|uniref:Uncharacterized protein n=1 Tax=bacterium (Candidatus Blackallbacteria) CG17_big_fil_post_rev_8_21_14_2_50_48_46 TaxID=2014261 RepID=A0A2M7FZ50_9BACT|nr:MAG: hypothetical protein COW64_14480 [bacterium (Candidatus Blackallbacteria) CG18_big_fil_WC_8_21_14_2_50_49_26]PIW14552.1 MAG: hypothetical protein COW36_21170 [bacterium (Candidatus Blackallbacteria) CG17_big_fil_post_rev_8_21_14_2_50_48_46]PIW47237.1 MAG: hypothetical protein COW20_13615 [bacterium (Candidatus Blackallbacteria) CG13_big_fil_rev_8_21_14_2_50_49_14]
MASNLTTYCLEKLTDYSEFERFCSDLMIREGFPNLIPLGGSKDKGRDAIHYTVSENITTIFAYSVIEDWQAKLRSDARKIHNHDHSCDQLVFLTTSKVQSEKFDSQKKFISDEYGFELDIFDIERLRLLVINKYPDIREEFPQIFNPLFLEIEKEFVKRETKKYISIIYSHENKIFADWISNKLLSLNYFAKAFAVPETNQEIKSVNNFLRTETFLCIPIVSDLMQSDANFIRILAVIDSFNETHKNKFILYLKKTNLNSNINLNNQVISFPDNWQLGLQILVDALQKNFCPKDNIVGPNTAFYSIVQPGKVINRQEELISNCLEVKTIPKFINQFVVNKSPTASDLARFKSDWPFKFIEPDIYLSFQTPSPEMLSDLNIRHFTKIPVNTIHTIKGIRTNFIINELLRKSLESYLLTRGLHFCPVSKDYYFPDGFLDKNRIVYTSITGRQTYSSVIGQRAFGTGFIKYYVCPVLTLNTRDFKNPIITLRIRVRVTDLQGNPFTGKQVVSRRKKVCKFWFNYTWLTKVLALRAFLENENEAIIIGEGEEQIRIDSRLIILNSPISIEESISLSETETSAEQEDASNFSDEEDVVDDYDSENL